MIVVVFLNNMSAHTIYIYIKQKDSDKLWHWTRWDRLYQTSTNQLFQTTCQPTCSSGAPPLSWRFSEKLRLQCLKIRINVPQLPSTKTQRVYQDRKMCLVCVQSEFYFGKSKRGSWSCFDLFDLVFYLWCVHANVVKHSSDEFEGQTNVDELC